MSRAQSQPQNREQRTENSPMNHRRPWHQRLRRRLPHLLPTILLSLLYLAGSIHLALQHCRLASLLCLVAAATTVAVSRRQDGLPALAPAHGRRRGVSR